MDFVKLVKEAQPAEGQVALFWLGQAGFLMKTASGRTIAIDPYFSDHVMRTENNIGFKRLTPPLCEADDIEFDVLLISHEHGDHFDIEAIGPMMANGKTQVYTNAPSAAGMEEVTFTGTGTGSEVTLGTDGSSCVIENAEDVALAVNGEDTAYVVFDGEAVFE